MDIFVINLAQAVKRRESIIRQLQDLNLPFEIFPAVFGKTLPESELAKCYLDAGARRIQCRSLTPSEIGCALSHIGVYREIVRRGIPSALILEDDVDLGKLNREILEHLVKVVNPSHPTAILLSPAQSRGPLHSLGVGSQLKLGQFVGGYCTHAYFITQSAARALLKALFPVKDVADCWSRLQRHRTVDILVLSPALVHQKQAELGSSTTEEICAQQQGVGLGGKILFKCRRAFWLSIDCLLGLRNRLFYPFAGTLRPPPSGDL